MSEITLDIGTTVQIDPVAGFRVFICAASGYGKSYLAAKLIEEILEKNFIVVVFDTEGEYYTLRQRYKVLIVGRDVPLDIDSADVYASLLIEKNVSIVFDFSAAEMSDIESQEFFAKFGERVFQLESKYKKPVILVVEEAEIFAPQQMRPQSLIIANKIAKRGRKRGIHSIWITQRPADFNKMILSQCNLIFAGRVIHERDKKALEPYVGRENIEYITKLTPREKILIQDNKSVIFTVSQRKTMHGADTPFMPLAKSAPELKGIAAEIAALITKRKREKELEKSKIEQLKAQIKELEKKIKEKDREIEKLKIALAAKQAVVTSLEIKTKPIIKTVETHAKTSSSESAQTISAQKESFLDELISQLPDYEKKILKYLRERPLLEFTPYQLAKALNYSTKSSRWTVAIARLRRLGVIPKRGRIKLLIKH